MARPPAVLRLPVHLPALPDGDGVVDKALTTSTGGFVRAHERRRSRRAADAFWSSVRLSLISAAAGRRPRGLAGLRRGDGATAEVAALRRHRVQRCRRQHGRRVLAFAFLTLIGRAGVATKILESAGYHLYGSGLQTVDVAGLTIVYLYFQIPLMLLVTLPAIDGLKPSWREASSNLGGTSWTYWRRVGLPVLTPVAARRLPPPLRQRVQRLRHRLRALDRRRQPRADQDPLLPAGRHRAGSASPTPWRRG